MASRQGGTLSGFTPLSTPNAPTGLSVSTNISVASVSFTAPSVTGDGAITSYIVTAIDESTGVSTGATGSASPIIFSPGIGTFKIRAQAVNNFGPGRLTEFDTGNVIEYSGAELYAWGRNSVGQLGTSNTTSRSSPVQVGALTNWSQVSAGISNASHTAAVKLDGTLWTWGSGTYGQLGHNNTTQINSPVQVGALTNWSQVSAGYSFTAAITANGELYAWGNNTNGGLGDGTIINRSSPVQIGALTNWAQVSTGSYFCAALKTDGTLWSWGQGTNGRLGNGTVVSFSSPVQIGALTTWAQVSAGLVHCAAVTTDSKIYTWGEGANGRLGHNNQIDRSSPVQVGALTNWAQVSAGFLNTSAVKTDGTLWGWGGNTSFGVVGDGTVIDRSSPVQVGALTNWSQVSTANDGCAAIKTDGTLWGWGSGDDGKIGDGTSVNKSSPVQVGALTEWLSVTVGNDHTLSIFGAV
jgi:alpha-tubulin suppressor-like RCC1 family protein